MKLFHLFLAFAFFGFSSYGIGQMSQPHLEITTPTVAQEATSVWRTINDIEFLEKQGYRINLPKNEVIDSLVAKSKAGNFGNDDYAAVYAVLENGIFNEGDYQKAIEKVSAQKGLINDLIQEIKTSKNAWDWDFKMFEEYPVVFTLYGTGGSYDPDTGTITILTNQEGQFMGYKDPANTIIHEITHMGMETSLVLKHKLPHGLKERIVDTFVYLKFKADLPEYRIQNMGDTKIDEHLKSEEDIAHLDAILSKFEP